MTPAQLKTSIFHAAIQGKISEQRQEDGDAETLINEIQNKKNMLINEKVIKKESLLAEVLEDEIPFDIPENWKWTRLGNIVSVFGGKRIPAGRQLSTENTGHCYIRVSDMKNGTVLTDGIQYVPDDIFPSISKYIINKEDIYITVAGTIGRIGKVPEVLDGANLTENADRLVVYSLCQDWLIYFLESDLIQNQIADATTKVGQPKLAIKRIQELVIPVPPINEQIRIVEKINELLKLVENYAVSWDKLEKINSIFPSKIKKSIFQYAMQGMLVEQRCEEGTAEEILELNNNIDQEVEILGGGPFEIPDTWKWVRLIDVITDKPSNGFSPKGVDYNTPFKNLTLSATTSGYFKEDAFKYVNITYEQAEKYYLRSNDILIQRSNSRDLVGTSCVYDGKDNEFIYPDLMMRIHTINKVDPYYIDFVLKSPFVRNYYTQSASGTSESMPKINQKIVSNTLIPLPPHGEQLRIVKKLKEMQLVCEKIGDEIN